MDPVNLNERSFNGLFSYETTTTSIPTPSYTLEASPTLPPRSHEERPDNVTATAVTSDNESDITGNWPELKPPIDTWRSVASFIVERSTYAILVTETLMMLALTTYAIVVGVHIERTAARNI